MSDQETMPECGNCGPDYMENIGGGMDRCTSCGNAYNRASYQTGGYELKIQEGRPRCPGKETTSPSEGGPPFTLAEIDESIALMEESAARYAQLVDQGRACPGDEPYASRLSLPMTRWLREEVERLTLDVASYSKALKFDAGLRKAAEAEVARLLQRTWDEHQDNDHPCTCNDCRTYARNSGVWAEVTDEEGRVVDFRPAVSSKEDDHGTG
jgi:hypothetical protein